MQMKKHGIRWSLRLNCIQLYTIPLATWSQFSSRLSSGYSQLSAFYPKTFRIFGKANQIETLNERSLKRRSPRETPKVDYPISNLCNTLRRRRPSYSLVNGICLFKAQIRQIFSETSWNVKRFKTWFKIDFNCLHSGSSLSDRVHM